MFIASIAFAVVASTKTNNSIVDEDFLTRVAVIESRCNSKAVGDNGKAIGAFQFHRSAWDMANRLNKSDYSYACASNWLVAKHMAKVYLCWLEESIKDSGYAPTKINLYMAYNMGLHGAMRYSFSPDHPELTFSRRKILARATEILNAQ